jgi:hypothetical protein
LLFAFPSIAGKLDREGLAKHLVDVHGLLIAVGKYVKMSRRTAPINKPKRKRSRRDLRSEIRTPIEVRGVVEDSVVMMKRA